MGQLRTFFIWLSIATLTVVLVGFGCGGSGNGSGFGNGLADGGGEGGTSGFSSGGASGEAGACQGFGCEKASCPGGGQTTITGIVKDPAGKNPLYDVAVYVPSTLPLPGLPQGMSCDRCGSTVLNPASSALTLEDGTFTLPDAPVDPNTPVVIQVGKWRRTYTIATTACTNNPMPMDLTLPGKGSDGDMPQMAVAVNALDSLECLLLGMGVDSSEFGNGAGGTGHVHMFPAADNETLWASESTLAPYDITLLDCEGQETPGDKSEAILQGMHDYAGLGGRIFATHYHYLWFKGTSPTDPIGDPITPQIAGIPDFVSTANWNPVEADGAGGNSNFTVDQTFPKGVSFAKWLVNVGASTTNGTIKLQSYSDSVNTVNAPPSTRWIYNSSNVEYMSFNTPTTAADDAVCGRVVFSDLHVSGNGVASIAQCPKGDLTAQQKALEFLLFDLSSCVQSDSVPPTPPK